MKRHTFLKAAALSSVGLQDFWRNQGQAIGAVQQTKKNLESTSVLGFSMPDSSKNIVHNLSYASTAIKDSFYEIYPTGDSFEADALDLKAAIDKVIGDKVYRSFSIASGGHGYIGSGVAPNAYVLNMKPFNRVSFDAEQKTLRVGGGANLFQVVKEINRLNIDPKKGTYALPVGDCFTVGISGFSVGGGKSMLGPMLGMMVDRIQSMTIITMDLNKNGRYSCQIRQHVNSTGQFRDLYWAILGGGGAHGLIADLTLKIGHISPKYRIFRAEINDTTPEIIEQFFYHRFQSTSSVQLQLDYLGKIQIHGVLSDKIDRNMIEQYISQHHGKFDVYFNDFSLPKLYTTYGHCDKFETCSDQYHSSQKSYFSSKSAFENKPADVKTLLDKLRTFQSSGYLLNGYAFAQFQPWWGAMVEPNPAVSFPHRKPCWLVQAMVKENDQDLNERQISLNDDVLASIKGPIREAAFLNHMNREIEEEEALKMYLGTSYEQLKKTRPWG
jgi:hypothetical protein